MRLAAYQPDIPQNTGALIRLCAGLDVPLELIEPFGFIWDERKIRASAMDYFDLAKITRHTSWDAFRNNFSENRVVLLSTKASIPYTEFTFKANDILLLGRESAGVPEEIHNILPDRVKIPMAPNTRSLNMAMAGAIILGESLRQTCQLPLKQV
ncbi:MAG TPA: tRNA (cytidine(34)-2'-O)-methyltransferase [Alphaproteobacteria bacterium]|nr:tRNA (cytidine(34)-2'-O)-methyltransferase [Alphaproteobacteria bacterium]HNS44153.1 tRNA (cytidine(34)-2'-O)-methyltransferase [Alphaproteobacteria bacterium]